jgi:hypothetical protein
VQPPDLDNLIKLVKDAMQGVLYANDDQISYTWMEKRFDESFGGKGHTLINLSKRVIEIQDDESKVKRKIKVERKPTARRTEVVAHAEEEDQEDYTTDADDDANADNDDDDDDADDNAADDEEEEEEEDAVTKEATAAAAPEEEEKVAEEEVPKEVVSVPYWNTPGFSRHRRHSALLSLMGSPDENRRECTRFLQESLHKESKKESKDGEDK